MSLTIPYFVSHLPHLFQSMKNCPQDGIYHAEGDVMTHTTMVIATLEALEEYHQLSSTEKRIVWLAALFHDVGKPMTTKHEGNRITAKGHSKKGANIFRFEVWSNPEMFGLSFDEREHICKLIENHQLPFFILDAPEHKQQFYVKTLSNTLNIKLLCILAKADLLGRKCLIEIQNTLLNIELLQLKAAEMGCFETPYKFSSSYQRFLYHRDRGETKSSDFDQFDTQDFDVFLLCGLPASGKDTLSKTLGIPMLSFDAARSSLKIKHGQNDGAAIHQVTEQVKQFCRNKSSFIWNATFLTEDNRSKAINLVTNYNGRVNLVYLEVPKKDILTRNSKRDSSLTNKKLLEMAQYKWTVPSIFEAPIVSYKVTSDF